MKEEILKEYNYWLGNLKDININDYNYLKNIKDEDTLNDLFYKDLTFGTGGLRGVMEVGKNRFNIYTIYKATRGFINYLLDKYKDSKEEISIVIGYDSRINSKEFAFKCANVFASFNIKVYLFSELIPTPVVSFAIRKLKAKGGIILTASHNPKEFNGYKVYNENAYQITLLEAEKILSYINKEDYFFEFLSRTNYKDSSLIEYIKEEVIDEFINSTLSCSVLKDFSKKNVKIVYTPLNGAGLKPVTKVLNKAGFNEIYIPKEQKDPDGHFLTCPFPNPELKEALNLAIKEAYKVDADLIIATDPDSDRCGVGIKHNNEFILLNGNEVATLILNFLVENKRVFKNSTVIRTVISTNIVDKIAKENDIKIDVTLTGFKFIGETISALEKENKLDNFLFGFEESFGFLTNKEVRDKDAVNASLLVAEMYYYYKNKGLTLIDELHNIYKKYGFYKSSLQTHTFLGEKGMLTMNKIMNKLRNSSFIELDTIFNEKVTKIEDYELQVIKSRDNNNLNKITLPKTNLLIIYLNNNRFMIRPSGTEPKLKCYIEVSSNNEKETLSLLENYQKLFEEIINYETK